jgi:Transglutaminase-like superfamily
MKPLLKLLHLHNIERQLLLKTFILLGLIRLGLALLPFQKMLDILANLSRTFSSQQPSEPLRLEQIVHAVELSSRYLPGEVLCLPRALTMQVLMRHQGYAPQLRIGVAKGAQGDLEAHAWVEHQGNVVMGYVRDLARYTPLPSFKGCRL